MSLRYALSPSGGAIYHLIARRRSRTTWKNFSAIVRDWLSEWLKLSSASPAPRELIIFGPSAGWTLPLKDFSMFSRITLVEPDPIARFLLRRRFLAAGISGASLEFISRADLLPWFSVALRSKEKNIPSAFANFLRSRPSAAILFANVLGQVSLHLSADQKLRGADSRSDFFDALNDRQWASYHDLYSGSSRFAQPLKNFAPGEVRVEALAKSASIVFSQGTVIDHETAWLSEGRDTQLALWPITEKSTHIIAFVTGATCNK